VISGPTALRFWLKITQAVAVIFASNNTPKYSYSRGSQKKLGNWPDKLFFDQIKTFNPGEVPAFWIHPITV